MFLVLRNSLLIKASNISLGWKSLTVTNTKTIYDNGIIAAVKSFIVNASGSLKQLKIYKLIQYFGATTFSIATLSITTFSRKGLFVTLSI